MSETNPSWATTGRQFVPTHLQPGSTRSSFARPDEYKLPRKAAASAVAPGGSGLSRSPRAGFASKSRSKPRRSGLLEADDELPPTQSIRVASHDHADAPPRRVSSMKVPGAHHGAGVPVVVFGFPPGAAPQVLQHFSRFGEITENASSATGDTPAAVAIECGRNWLRITYRDREAAQRALAQNGHVMPGQYVIGCVPAEQGEYTSSMQQSSTNSLLLDDSEVSMLQDQSLASVLEDDSRLSHTDEASTSANGTHGSDEPISVLGSGAHTGSDSSLAGSPTGLDSHYEKIVPRGPTSTLFKQSPKPLKPASTTLLTEATSTKLPPSEEPKGLASRVLQKAGDILFGWDI